MNQPSISFDIERERLLLDLGGMTDPQVEAFNDKLILWRKGKGSVLWSQPLYLAYVEAKELFPNLHEGEGMEAFWDVVAVATEALEDVTQYSLYDVQKTPTAILSQRTKALLTGAPGVGKTIMAAVAAHIVKPGLTVIVTTPSLLTVWINEFDKWFAKPLEKDGLWVKALVWTKYAEVVESWKTSDQDYTVIFTTYPVINKLHATEDYELELDRLFGTYQQEETLLIVDESYLYKNRKAKRTIAMSKMASCFDRCWELSGMPISKFNDNLYAQLYILHPNAFRSYWKFAERYCLLQTTVWGTSIVGNMPGATERLNSDLKDILLQGEYPDDVPDWIPRVRHCPMTERQEKIYVELRDKLKVDAELLGRDTSLSLKNLLTLTGKLCQVASNPLLIEGINESGKWETLYHGLQVDQTPALVWVNYLRTAYTLEAELKAHTTLRVKVMTGRTPVKERSEIVKEFQAGAVDVLILNPGVGKYGHTLTAAHTAYYLELSFDREAFYQSLFRARRINSKHSVNLIYLLSTMRNGEPTIDGFIYDLVTKASVDAQILTVGELLGTVFK